MKNRILLAAFSCLCFFSCKKNEVPVVETTTTAETPTAQAAMLECYQYNNGKDTIQANLAIKGDNVSGDLAYRFFEKDKNSGHVSGTKNGDTLNMEYNFQSEGMQSVREVVFLRKNNKLTEGYGDIEEKDGKVIFKNKRQLQFNRTVLNKIPCN